MCVVSVITEAIGNQLPPLSQWNYQQVTDLSQVIKLLEGIDKKLGAKDCINENKQKFLDELDLRIRVLEAKHREENVPRGPTDSV